MSDPTPRRRFDTPEQEAYLNLWRAYDRLRAVEDELFSSRGLTAQQYNALRLLRPAGREGMPTLALASRLISRAPDITRLVDRLEEGGWVTRIRPPGNRREVRVAITAPGLALLKALAPAVRRCGRRQLGHLTRGQLAELTALLKAARAPHDDGGW
jgi:DNA-binding MarR family transcriptional regulator